MQEGLILLLDLLCLEPLLWLLLRWNDKPVRTDQERGTGKTSWGVLNALTLQGCNWKAFNLPHKPSFWGPLNTWVLFFFFLHIDHLKSNTYSHRNPTFYPYYSRMLWHTISARLHAHQWYSPSIPSSGRGTGRCRILRRLCLHSPQELFSKNIYQDSTNKPVIASFLNKSTVFFPSQFINVVEKGAGK